MMRALSTAGTGMIAQQLNLDTISNNLANVNTTGFKGQRAEFQDLVYQTFRDATTTASTSQNASQVGLGSALSATGSDFTADAKRSGDEIARLWPGRKSKP